MKNILIYTLLVSMVLTLSFCKKEEEPKPMNLSEKALKVVESSNEFGLDLYGRVLKFSEAGKNVMISPLSISQALSMTYNGAAGNTRLAFEQTLRIPDLTRDEFNEKNKELVDALRLHDPNVILQIANSIWYRDEYEILADFVDRNKTYYEAEVSASDFEDPATLDVINNWVDEKTNHKIDKIIDQINPESFMFLINAIYFKGQWEYEFEKKDTHNRDFTLGDGTVIQVPMMHQELDLNMLHREKFTSVELPYGKGNWKMFLFVPNSGYGLSDLNGDLTAENWSNWMAAYEPAPEVNLYMPRFSFSFKQNLNDALIDMGLGNAFETTADFSDIAPGLPLSITKVMHKTFIDVNEEGTEAAAVTSVEIELTSIGNFYYVNQPFLFAIAERSTGTILFIGQVVNPSLTE